MKSQMERRRFSSRFDAAEQLIPKLRDYIDDNTVILAIPRGGVPMARQIANALHVPFDIIMTKKIGHPSNPELAVGAVFDRGELIDTDFNLASDYLMREIKRLKSALKEREKTLRGAKPPLFLKGKTVIIVDDGLATGHSMSAAIASVMRHSPGKIIVAVPVSSPEAIAKIQSTSDEFICLHCPTFFNAVAEFYDDFSEVTDREVIEHMQASETASIQ